MGLRSGRIARTARRGAAFRIGPNGCLRLRQKLAQRNGVRLERARRKEGGEDSSFEYLREEVAQRVVDRLLDLRSYL